MLNTPDTAFSALLAGSTVVGNGPSDMPVGRVLGQTALCVLASYAFCGAGMVWNDWIDRDIDVNVSRTKDRPLAAGRVTTGQAMLWMFVQITVCWGLLHVMLEGVDVYVFGLPLPGLVLAADAAS